jgi:hypothetical protein
MGVPQGTGPVNVAQFSEAIAQVEACANCAALQSAVNSVYSDLTAFINALIAQNAVLGPMQALLTAPTSPTAAVTWIQSYITTVLTPQIAVYTVYAAKATALATQITALANAISSAQGKFPGCAIVVPTLPAIPAF